ncbi:hypothetical protein ADIS_3970 [Lunatimonas lonarensis]|uniref:Uncharacterized protein n=1 Tax=Lunatimonas lonarensis TaxID=1232681 RepID=R7ZNA8_9BACT|nr:hypothetical protein ADIS_3970 [Lunatimonas lonarensis]
MFLSKYFTFCEFQPTLKFVHKLSLYCLKYKHSPILWMLFIRNLKNH